MKPFPRIMVLSDVVPHSFFAGQILLYRLFQSWPSDRLLVVGSGVPDGAEKLSCEYIRFQPRFWRLETSRFAKLSRLLTISGFRSAMASSMQRLIQFQPQVVLTVMQNLSYSDAAYRFSRKYNVPMIVIVHDDPEDFERTYPWAASLIANRNACIYRHAAKRLCISPEMRGMLSERYGVEGEVMFPNRSESLVPRAVGESLALKNRDFLTLGYAGALNYGYGERLEQLLPVFRQAGVRLRIYSRQSPWFSDPGAVSYVGNFPSPEIIWQKVKAECDAVILPYCYAERGHQNVYRTHFPSKLPEYLALGMPVVIGGPKYATGVKWGLRNPEACLVITEREISGWLDVLTRLRSDSKLRLQLSKGAVTAGNRDFDPGAIRSAFMRALYAAAMV